MNRATARYGDVIDKKSYSTGSIMRLVVIILAILIVPMQLVCQGVISTEEQTLILNLQSHFAPDNVCVKRGEWCNTILTAPIWLMGTEHISLVFYFLHLCTDSLLTFKATILTGFGLYFLAMMQMIFKSGRPFWDNARITSYGHCKFDFASPT